MKVHRFYSDERPPLCGQRNRTGKAFLPVRCTTEDAEKVTCSVCWDLQPLADIPSAMDALSRIIRGETRNVV